MVTSTQTKLAKKARTASSIRGYDSALSFLRSHTDYEQMVRIRYNTDTFNLDRMRLLLKKMGNPHEKIKTVHIAGTKGKGSTAMMLSTMLQSCGYTVGLYMSPHITDLRERIKIDEHKITQKSLGAYIAKIAPFVEKMEDDKPTFFEILTCISFCCFADEGVDIAIIETGLGGRLDSTNVLTPEVCGLTSISMDHMNQLGTTIADIAQEKAGILKPSVPAISVEQDPEAEKVLRKMAAKTKSPLRFTGHDIEFSYRVESSRRDGCHTRVCLTTPQSKFEHLPIPVFGEHQAINCGLALALLDQLKLNGMAIDDEKAIEGLSKIVLPGRMEIICEDPKVLVDGAHNAASIKALIRGVSQHIPYDSMVMVFGCAMDKDIHGMIQQIAKSADKVIFTKASDCARSADPKQLAEMYSEMSDGKIAQVADTLVGALGIANSAVSQDDIIVVTGSFYLVGDAKRIFHRIEK